MKTRQCTRIHVSIFKHTDGSAGVPPHLSETAAQNPPSEQTILSLSVLSSPLLQGGCEQRGHSERWCANRECGEGRCWGGQTWHSTPRWPPSHEGLSCVPTALLEGEQGGSPWPGPGTVDSWILQNIIVKADLPVEKYAAHSQAKYK